MRKNFIAAKNVYVIFSSSIEKQSTVKMKKNRLKMNEWMRASRSITGKINFRADWQIALEEMKKLYINTYCKSKMKYKKKKRKRCKKLFKVWKWFFLCARGVLQYVQTHQQFSILYYKIECNNFLWSHLSLSFMLNAFEHFID